MNRPGRIPQLLAAALVLAGCDVITGPGRPAPTWAPVALDERVRDAYTDFGFELFRQLRGADPDANLFLSPTSAAFALAMTYNGAAGHTAEEMALALGVGAVEQEALNEASRDWLAALRETGDPRAELTLANSVWYRETRPILESFRQLVVTYYDAEIAPITTAAAINDWVRNATRGRIEEIVGGEIPGTVVAYLINALYFKADWTHPFDESATRDAPFHRTDGSTVTVPMMYRRGEFEVRADDTAQMLRLPYGAGRFSMVLALPREGAGLGSIAERLEGRRWQEWMAELGPVSDLEVRLPRFELEWDASLKDALRAMGMDAPFEAGLADFSRMFEGGGPWIEDVLQKTFLRVDEKGTEAAAVTKVGMVESAPPEMTFDRPFSLAIYDHATDTVLFLGQVTDPTG